MSVHHQISKDILKLRIEKLQLQKDERALRKLIQQIKTQVDAVQIEQLEIKNRQPELTDDYLKELASGANQESDGTDVLEQMVKGSYLIEEENHFQD
jgi:hypothetical protein